MKRSLFLASLCLFFLIGCSSTNRYQYYKSAPEENSLPRVTQEPELVRLTYKTAHRSIFQNDFHQSAWLKVSNFGRALYTVGPIFLPIVPAIPESFWGAGPKLDESQNIEITLTTYSDLIFNDKIIALPELEIETPDGRVLTAKIKSEGGPGVHSKTFVYVATVSDTPWFILRSAEIKLDNGKVLTIPRLKFTMTSEFIVNWYEPVAP